ncbi:hypothetical protein F7734_39425 [Scytonema sp. UIC 10036]|uniref:helix-turn-helix domain-containing protein n=1 Tax=Scytonema sp. UIC 10036 TaxID=2304196 RepID=UPI0012DA7887|nr:helix-turn-helix transcriptional regulator [Scytonema sp. UIC 10036]MUG98061.1 hypothetical protein [Scytonema sp. UIC 10036]
MIPFTTSPEQKIRVYEISTKMAKVGLSVEFITDTVAMIEECEGLHDLMVLWDEETDVEIKDEILADIQDEIDRHKELPHGIQKKPYISFDDLDRIAKDIMEFKKSLRDEVDRWGGITKLSEKTGIPEPSLNRFFNSASMPYRTTLYKIANALKLTESQILSKWAA